MFEIRVFEFEGIEVRVILDEIGNQWWLFDDLSRILGGNYTWMAMKRIAVRHRRAVSISCLDARPQESVAISTAGVHYIVLNKSGKNADIAKLFMDWMLDEVEPKLRLRQPIDDSQRERHIARSR